MPEHGTEWEMEMVHDLARAIQYPATPELWHGMSSHLERDDRPRPRPLRLAMASALMGVVLVAAAALVVSDDARDAVAGFLGLAVQGERIEVLPTQPPGSASATPVALEFIAREVPVEGVAASAGFEPLLPADAGTPSAAYLIEVQGVPILILKFDNFALWQFELGPGQPEFVKGIPGEGVIVDEVRVAGAPAYWIRGGSRIVTIENADGTTVTGTRRTVLEPAIVWNRDGRYLRIEGIADRTAAIALAESVE